VRTNLYLLVMVLLLSGGLFAGGRSVMALSTPTAASVNLGPSATEKASAKLRAMAQAGGFLPVFVVLRSQPHREILERHESASRLKLDILEDRYLQLQRQTFAAEAELQEAKVALEEAALQTRQAAFKEIQGEIGPGQEAIALLLTQLGAKNIQRYSAINMLAADVPALALGALEADSSVVEIAPIETHSAQLAVSVPSLGAPAFWSAGYAGASESVAVLDTGVRTSHPAFSGLNIVSKVFLDYGKQDRCFADDANSPEDKQGHGTHVAGIVASRGAPGWSGYWGVARGLGTLYNLKIAYLNKCTGRGNSNTADVVNALQWAVEQAPWVKAFNYSYGGDTSTDDDIPARLFDYFADTYGLTISVAAGNESKSAFLGLWTNPGPLSSPGIGYNVITVAAMNTQGTIDRSDDEIAIFSSRGPTVGGRKKPDFAAPGGLRDRWDLWQLGWIPDRGIYSADYNSDGFVPLPGTSMAAPHIAGAATLLRASGIQDPLAIKALLLNTTDALNWVKDQGWGYANLTRAFAQRDSALTSTLSSGRVRLYKGLANGLFYSTLTWNRSVFQTLAGGCLSNLDLFLYNGSSGALLSFSTSSTDNVEKAYTTSYGPLVVNVTHWSPGSCRSPETLGVAFSEAGFQSATGPVLSVSCTAPAAVAPSAQFSAACTVTNRGDLPAMSVQGALGFAGSTSSSSQDLGTIPPAGSSTKTWLVTAPASTGTFTLQLAAQSDSFGGRFSGSASVTFSSTTGFCTIAVSPTALTFGASQGSNPPAQSFTVNNSGGGTLTWTATVTTTSGGNWLSVAPTSGSAGNSVQVTVNSASLGPGTYTGTISIASASPGVTNSPQAVSVSLIVQPGGVGACCGPEPSLSVTVDPGFYIASSTIQAGGAEGYWEMSVEPQRDQRGGGFIFGGGIQEKGMTPYFAAFLLSSPQEVLIQLNPRLLPGGDASKFSACARLLDGRRQQIGTERCSTGFIEFRQTLPPDFYIIEVRTGALSPGAYFEFLLGERDLPAGLIVGGFLSSEVPGFIAFSVAQRQEVRIKAAGRCAFGAFAAKCLRLTLYDSNRNIVAVSGSAGGAASLDLIAAAGNGTLASSGDCGPSTAALPNPADAPTGDNVRGVVGIGGRGSNAARPAVR